MFLTTQFTSFEFEMVTFEITIDLLPTLPAIHVIVWDIFIEDKQDPSCDFIIIILGFELHASLC